ncbi:MAG: branched-chain amino acid ABC transporter permease [Acetobacteraceae bacterium]
MGLLIQLLANGVINGSHYALLGIGFGLIFGTTGIVHFAYGPLFAAAAYVIWWLATAAGLPFLLAAAIGTLVAAALGILSYVAVYRPLLRRRSSPFSVLVSSLGLFVIVSNLIGILFGTDAKTANIAYGTYFLGDTVITGIQLSQLAALVVVGLLLAGFLRFTPYGNSVRAMADNVQMARIIGIPTERVTLLVFGLGSAISAVPAAHILVRDGALPGMGFVAVFYAFICVVVGGVGSIWGAALGGLLIGLVESAGMWRIPSEWESTIAFLVLFAILLWRPTGLLKGA